MGSKKKAARTNSSPPLPAPESGGPPWVLIGGVLVVAALGGIAMFTGDGASESATTVAEATQASSETEPADPTPRPEAPPAPPPEERVPRPAADAVMPPLPMVPNLVPRSPDVVRAAYTFAAERPDVLEFVPCFCGCETAGHSANAHCFVESRNADGSVRSWDTHGMSCIVCIDVARDSMQLTASGASVRDVRAAIETKYASVYPRQTPTPAPPTAND